MVDMKYSYSYKLDSSSEIIGYVHANSMPEAVYMISIKKDLPDSEVVKLFNIYIIILMFPHLLLSYFQ